ncbi:MAG: zinc ribbon domain-containing protein [Actinomycetes bacterium]
MACDVCGADNPIGSKFCVMCGERIALTVLAVVPPLPAPPAPPAPPPSTPPSQPLAQAPVLGGQSRVHPPPVQAPPPPLAPAAVEFDEAVVAPMSLPAEPPTSPGVIDPNGLNAQVIRLSAASQRSCRAALLVLSTLLDPVEVVEGLVAGHYQGRDGLVALTNVRLIFVNDHEWAPDIRLVPLGAGLAVEGWQDDRTASLIFGIDGQRVSVSTIADRLIAQEMAHQVRARVAAL